MSHYRTGVFSPVSSVSSVVPGHWHQLSSPRARLRQGWRQMGPGRNIKEGKGSVGIHVGKLEPSWGCAECFPSSSPEDGDIEVSHDTSLGSVIGATLHDSCPGVHGVHEGTLSWLPCRVWRTLSSLQYKYGYWKAESLLSEGWTHSWPAPSPQLLVSPRSFPNPMRIEVRL